jgi:NADPH:quinone reductase-like Zn-dependent oxidoreductase
MKAIYCAQYGPPEKLEIRELPIPTPKEDQVLIKVMATAINDYDWSVVRGKPYLYRLLFGLKRPKHAIPGMEFSGIIEEVGSKVKTFKKGDEVFGDTSDHEFGTMAEFCCLNQGALNLKPDFLSHQEATATPHAGLLAWQGMLSLGQLQAGEKVLINGGGGGVGAFGVQIARAMNCEVDGVDTGSKLQLMKDWGYQEVMDYKQVDFTKNEEQYDLILDCKSNRNWSKYKKTLTANGRYITVGGQVSKLLKLFIAGKFNSGSKKVKVLALKPNKEMNELLAFMQKHQIKPQLDGPYKLEEAAKQIARFGAGEHFGKVIISPDSY